MRNMRFRTTDSILKVTEEAERAASGPKRRQAGWRDRPTASLNPGGERTNQVLRRGGGCYQASAIRSRPVRRRFVVPRFIGAWRRSGRERCSGRMNAVAASVLILERDQR